MEAELIFFWAARQEIGTVEVSGQTEEWEHRSTRRQQAQSNCLFSKHDTRLKVKVKSSQAYLFYFLPFSFHLPPITVQFNMYVFM